MPGVEDPGDVGVVHHRQGLALGLEPGDDLLRVHAGLDDLQRDPAADGLGLLGHVDGAHAAFADLLQELVGADGRAELFGARRCPMCQGRRRGLAIRGSLLTRAIHGEEFFEALPQVGILPQISSR